MMIILLFKSPGNALIINVLTLSPGILRLPAPLNLTQVPTPALTQRAIATLYYNIQVQLLRQMPRTYPGRNQPLHP